MNAIFKRQLKAAQTSHTASGASRIQTFQHAFFWTYFASHPQLAVMFGYCASSTLHHGHGIVRICLRGDVLHLSNEMWLWGDLSLVESQAPGPPTAAAVARNPWQRYGFIRFPVANCWWALTRCLLEFWAWLKIAVPVGTWPLATSYSENLCRQFALDPT